MLRESETKLLEKELSLEKIASEYYADVPFHNFEHIKDVLDYAEGVMEECEKMGIAVDKEAIREALLFHDAGYHKNNKEKGFNTKEEYSSSIAENELEKAGYLPDFIEKVESAIMATMKDGKFSTNEQKIVRMSDISNMTGEYKKFLERNIRLKNEIKYMNNKTFSWDEWKKSTKNIMDFYINQSKEMTITGGLGKIFPANFREKIEENLERFLSEDDDALQDAQKEFEKKFYSKSGFSPTPIKSGADLE